ncbi:DUF928 domain-containing protein [Capilliphycus salinus ALCB114379]|uniref:DUF928 domain-containing protein n=1 Tax=Capilliphycus salinus TaxID=2768948 RepID=UPI0039A5165A
MTRIKLYLTTLLFFLTLTGRWSYAIDNSFKISSFFQVASNDNFDFDGDGRPGNRQGGSSRGNCPPTQPTLTALIPEKNLGLSTKEHPTFWFYIPYNSTDIPEAELMLLDENQRPVLEKPMKVQLSGTPGIVGVTLPSTAKPLELEQEYHWFFELNCDSENPSNNPRVDGWIKRVKPSSQLMNQLEHNQIKPRYLVYIENGIWYDALTNLIGMMRVNASDSTLKNDWSNLLESVELKELLETSITDCCSVK